MFPETAKQAFTSFKSVTTKIALFMQSHRSTPIFLIIYASENAVGAVSLQYTEDSRKLLALCSGRLHSRGCDFNALGCRLSPSGTLFKLWKVRHSRCLQIPKRPCVSTFGLPPVLSTQTLPLRFRFHIGLVSFADEFMTKPFSRRRRSSLFPTSTIDRIATAQTHGGGLDID